MNLIEKAVLPLKVDAIERATKEAKEYVAKITAALEAADGDVNIVAPYPFMHSGLNQFQRMAALRRHEQVHALVTADPNRKSRHGMNDPYYAVMDEAKINRFIQDRIDGAIADYDSFVAKLITKIGDVTSARLSGNHVWSYSILIVTKPDGEEQAWKTQQIVNVSKLGRYFNQWPSRKMKRVPKLEEAA